MTENYLNSYCTESFSNHPSVIIGCRKSLVYRKKNVFPNIFCMCINVGTSLCVNDAFMCGLVPRNIFLIIILQCLFAIGF